MSNTTDIITIIRGLIKDLLKTDGKKAYTYYTDNKFLLPESFVDSTSISVYQNGTLLSTDDWSYSSTTNRVTITFVTSGFSLTSGDSIEIKFSYYAKYSDTELISYIESTLVLFVQKRYKKLFLMDSANKIITYNGINPTKDEEYIIALITAINIEPQNINIKTKGFSITAIESASKSEQIATVFRDWLRTRGVITFNESEDTEGDTL